MTTTDGDLDREALEALVVEREVRTFLNREAALLDQRRLAEWFDLIAEDVTYRMPRRLMQEDAVEAFSDEAYFFDERYSSLEARVQRFESEYAWAERPPSRTRRYVTNVDVQENDDGEIEVRSNLLVYYSQGDTAEHTFLSTRREDTLRRTGDTGDFEIAARTIYPDHTVTDMSKISIFL